MEVAQGIMELIYVGVGILTTGIPLAIAIIALFKGKNKNQIWNMIMTIADAAIIEAEQSGKSGASKKQMVMDAVAAGLRTQGIEIAPFEQQLESYIESCVEFSKKVNIK